MMKLFTLSLLAALSVASGSSSLRGDFDADVVDNSSRNLAGDCVARSAYMGCYKNRNNERALKFKIDDRFHSAEDCETKCHKLDFRYFAREWKGQCYCGNNSDYDKHGKADDCECCAANVGARRMCVWMAGDIAPKCNAGDVDAPYLGCYGDKNRDRAMPYRVDGRQHSAEDCQEACADKGMKYFGREFRGQCFCSNDDDFDTHGTARSCDCCEPNVGGGKICVWKV